MGCVRDDAAFFETSEVEFRSVQVACQDWREAGIPRNTGSSTKRLTLCDGNYRVLAQMNGDLGYFAKCLERLRSNQKRQKQCMRC